MSLTLFKARQSIEDPIRTITIRTTTNSELLSLPSTFLSASRSSAMSGGRGGGHRVECIEVNLSPPGSKGSPLGLVGVMATVYN